MTHTHNINHPLRYLLQPFQKVYDATTQFGAKVGMRKICLCTLVVDDVVLLETTAEARANNDDKKDVVFTLESLSVIAFAPRSTGLSAAGSSTYIQ